MSSLNDDEDEDADAAATVKLSLMELAAINVGRRLSAPHRRLGTSHESLQIYSALWTFLLSNDDDDDCRKTVFSPLHNVIDSIFHNYVTMCVADHVRVL